jgi:putative zinc finger/helix-turn-helix YgiT family protein
MEEHEVSTVKLIDTAVFKGVTVEYEAVSNYCDLADEYYETEEMLAKNDMAMKNAYRSKMGLLTTDEIVSIRSKYGISQSDLCILLGWGGKTITRYEGHQVQDNAHDSILKKLDNDPEWFLDLLEKAKSQINPESFSKYHTAAIQLYEDSKDSYLRKAIQASYAKYAGNGNYNGNTELNLDKVLDSIRFFANSKNVTSLYKVKLMKLLWYADALSFKRYEHSITGLVYRALAMGAVPIAYESIVDMNGIEYEEVEFDEGTGFHFISSNNQDYPSLTDANISVLEAIISKFGKSPKAAIVKAMHDEVAYTETAKNDIIQFKYAKDLSID